MPTRHLSFACLASFLFASVAGAQEQAASLANLSTRMRVEMGDNVLIAGFIITGNEPKKVMLRAMGPTLTGFGVAGALQDPTLELFQGGTSLATNDNWKDSLERADIEASNLAPSSESEAAIVRTLSPGAYTAIMRGQANSTGVGLVELYDLETGADAKMANLSTRGPVRTGDNVMIVGTIVEGEGGTSQRVLMRAKGPSLPLAGTLANPTLELINADGVVLRSNDDWRSDQEIEIQSAALEPASDLEAALVETLRPGRYTAIVRGAGGSSGVGLVEVYTLATPEVWPLAGDDPNLASTADLEPLRGLIGDATVAAFGESYHTSGGFYRMKHRIFRFLVEKMGFRAFAMETGWEGGLLAENYVQTGQGTAEQAISQHINVWQGTEYADVIRWIRQWNSTHPNPADKIAFFGFDIQQPKEDAAGLATYLERVGIPRTDPRSTGLTQCEAVNQNHPFGQVPPERHNACLQTLSAIENHFTANKPSIVQQTSAPEFDIAMLRVVGMRAFEDQVFIIAHDRPLGYSARDAGMAYAFNVMRGMKAPNAKTMVWAANSHVARAPLVTGEVPMGSFLADTFGEKYANFALNAFVTEVDYGTCGPVARQPDSLEDALEPIRAAQGAATVLVDTRSTSVLPRRTYATGIDQLRPHLEYDGIIFLQHSPKFHPLLWAPCQ